MTPIEALRAEFAAMLDLHKGKKRANQPGYVRVKRPVKGGKMRWDWVPATEAADRGAESIRPLEHQDAWEAFEHAAVQIAADHGQSADRVHKAFVDAKAAAQRGDPSPIGTETAKDMMHASNHFMALVGGRVPSGLRALDDDDFLNRAVYAVWQAHTPLHTGEHAEPHWTTADPDSDYLGDVRWTDERYTDKDGEQWRKVLVYGNPYQQRERWHANGRWKLEHPQELDQFRQKQEDHRQTRLSEAAAAEKKLEHIDVSTLRDQRNDMVHALSGKHTLSDARRMVDERIAMLEMEEHTRALARKAEPHVADLKSRVGNANAVVIRDPHGYVRGVHGGAGATLEARTDRGRAALHVNGRKVLEHEKLEEWRVKSRRDAARRGEHVGPEHPYEFVETDIPAAVLERVQNHPDQVRTIQHKGQTFYASRRPGMSEWAIYRPDGRKVGGKLYETLSGGTVAPRLSAQPRRST